MLPMMECQLHCLYGFRFLMKPEAQTNRDGPSLSRLGTMCRGSNVKDTLVTAFQLESLILAQNERWRQA